LILDELAANSRKRAAAARAEIPLDRIRGLAEEAARAEAEGLEFSFPFEKALAPNSPARTGCPAFICEGKRSSPSRGLIAPDFPYLDIARDYQSAGAAAISVLTEPDYFLGSEAILREIAATVKTPLLRKDFIVDPWQIYETKVLGAHALLLICALLDRKTLEEYRVIAEQLGLSALVETHSADEIKTALDAGAKIIGINNRDLKTFTVDIGVSAKLRELIPPGIISVSESGIKTTEDLRFLKPFGFDAFLIGETLMLAADKKQSLAELREASRAPAKAET
jgi:indole-3-glycerol phosphate synthase